MALSIRDCTIIDVVQSLSTKVMSRYSASWGIQCSCMSLISISWTLSKSPGLWDNFDLDCILGKGHQLYKFTSKYELE